MKNKKFLYLVLVFLIAIIIGVVKFNSKTTVKKEETEMKPSSFKPVLPQGEEIPKQREKIKPIVIGGEDEKIIGKPDSFDSGERDADRQKIFNEIKAGMSPEFLEKLKQTINESKTSEGEENMKKIDEQMSSLEKEIDKHPSNNEAKEELQRLLELKAYQKVLQDTFL